MKTLSYKYIQNDRIEAVRRAPNQFCARVRWILSVNGQQTRQYRTKRELMRAFVNY